MGNICNWRHPAKEICGRNVSTHTKKKKKGIYFVYKYGSPAISRDPGSMRLEEQKVETDDIMEELTNLLILKGILLHGATDTENPKAFA